MDLSSGPSKRARMSGNGSQVPFCLVDGCTSDLSKCRDYHRRHKVCELHSKTARVSIKGQEQRFCQQCSRFHSLGEFDEGKRSCRKRLEGHNRRRRKPQPDPLNVNSSTLFPNHQGSRYIHFGRSQIFSASAATAALTGVVKAEDEFVVYNCQSSLNFSGRSPLPGSLSNRYKGGKQFPFLQGSASMFPGGSTGQANLDATSNLVDSGNSQKMFSDGLNRAINSNCALSLLSSPPAETGEINLSHMVQPDLSPPAQSLISNLDYNSIGMESEPVGSFLVAGSGSNANLHGHNMFHILPDGSSASGAQQTLSFTWE